MGLISDQSAMDLLFIGLGLTLYYRFYIAQTTLETNWSIAAGVALIDFLLLANFSFALRHVAGLWVATG